MFIPNGYEDFKLQWAYNRKEMSKMFSSGQHSFIASLLPEDAMQLSVYDTLELLSSRYGDRVMAALDPLQTIESPLAQHDNSEWIKSVNIAGINIRTIGSFWNVIHYTLTLPASQQAIHLLPIWEPGVVDSLYGMSSWNINPEFFSSALADTLPSLDTVEKQLKVVVNLLHLMGRSVGMDVIPHTDRYSEIVLANPQYFEWLEREDLEITDHSSLLYRKVQVFIFQYLKQHGAAIPGIALPASADALFGSEITEKERLQLLFGKADDYEGRQQRRAGLVQFLFKQHFETAPATMGPPYRGLMVNPDEAAKTVDSEGRIWRDYVMTRPEPMSRVFGPLTRYHLYESKNNNADWELDFSQPRKDVWDYVCSQYRNIQEAYGFDFMRGDMAHVQMRAEGVPVEIDDYYDILKAIRRSIAKKVPHFAFFAETFLAPAGTMAYGDEADHLEAADADTTLGDLQSIPVHTDEFSCQFRWYLDLLATRRFKPCFTVMTGDKDDPRFDAFYLDGNELRMFMAFFLTDMPSYMALGFECRDPHPVPAPNEHYTKLYVFRIQEGDKATHGPFVWGKNGTLFHRLTRLRLFAERIFGQIAGQLVRWLLPPDPTGGRKVIAWTLRNEMGYVFVVNLDTQNDALNIRIPDFEGATAPLRPVFSTINEIPETEKALEYNGYSWPLASLGKGEARVFMLEKGDPLN